MYINFLENTIKPYIHKLRVSQGSVVKNQPANAGDASSIPGSGRSLEKEMATHSSISCLGKSMDRAARQAAVHGIVKESDTT